MVECSSGAGAATHTIDGWRAPAAQRWRNAVTAAGTSTARWRAYKAGRIGYAGAATLPAAKPSRLATLADPDYAATKSFQALLKVPGWQTMALTDAAQAVQKSAFPDAYAKWEPEATVLVSALTGAVADCTAAVGPMGWVAPVHAAIVS